MLIPVSFYLHIYTLTCPCIYMDLYYYYYFNIYFVLTELQALAEIVGPYGIQFMGDRLMEQVSAQVKEIRKLVEQNQDTLLALHTNRDKPDIFNDLLRKLRSK